MWIFFFFARNFRQCRAHTEPQFRFENNRREYSAPMETNVARSLESIRARNAKILRVNECRVCATFRTYCLIYVLVVFVCVCVCVRQFQLQDMEEARGQLRTRTIHSTCEARLERAIEQYLNAFKAEIII